MNDKKFMTCLNCMDGRAQTPVLQWIKDNYAVDYVDMITEAGMDGVLADENADIKKICVMADVSLERSQAGIIFIAGHNQCLGNPVSEEQHKKHIRAAAARLKKLKRSCRIIGLWVTRQGYVEKVTEQ